MKNFVQEGKKICVSLAGIISGDPVAIGSLVGVAITDTDSDGNVVIRTEGVFTLNVHANDGSAASAVAVGDKLYSGGSGALTKDDSTIFLRLCFRRSCC